MLSLTSIVTEPTLNYLTDVTEEENVLAIVAYQ